MSVFSIIQTSQQQLFSLQMKGRMPETAKLPAGKDKTESDKQAKADEKAIATAENLVETTSPQTEERQSEADDIVEDFKDAVDLNSTLFRAVKDGADTEREMRIERMAQKIKAMKEKIRFATPEKAKRMLQELQQISKDFKTASLELRKAAGKIGPDRPNAVVDIAADATVAALGETDGASDVTLQDLLGYADDLTTSLQSVSPAISLPVNSVETGAEMTATTEPAVSGPALSSASAGETGDFKKAASLFDAIESSGFMERLQNELTFKNDSAFRKASVYAYADMQHQSDSFYRQGRIEGMRAEHEALTKLFEEIKLLAGQLEAMADEEDEDVQEALESIIKNLAQGYEVLDEEDLQQFLGAGRYAPPEGTGLSGATGPSMTVSMSSISVETSVSISISV